MSVKHRGNNMYLRKITFVSMIAIIVAFSIRVFGTFYPQIFRNILIIKATIVINVLFLLVLLLFWIVFYREYIAPRKVSLKKVCILVICGSFAVSLIYIKKLPVVFGLDIRFPLILITPYFDVLVPLTSTVFHLIFFIAFKKSLENDEKSGLNKATLSIIIGNSIFICLHLIVLDNLFERNMPGWFVFMPRFIAVGTVPLIIVAVCFMLYFYFQFYRFLGSVDNNETKAGFPSRN